jgi:transcriptional regulator with XRE-family HTH domain
MTIDEIKLQNLKRLCNRDHITTGAELGRRLGLKGNSAKSTGNQLFNGKRHLVGKTLKDLCILFNVKEDEFLLPNRPEVINTVPVEVEMESDWQMKAIIEQMSRRMDDQQKHIDNLAKVITRYKDEMEKMWEVLNTRASDMATARQDISMMTNSILSIKSRMIDAAQNGDIKCLGELEAADG